MHYKYEGPFILFYFVFFRGLYLESAVMNITGLDDHSLNTILNKLIPADVRSSYYTCRKFRKLVSKHPQLSYKLYSNHFFEKDA